MIFTTALATISLATAITTSPVPDMQVKPEHLGTNPISRVNPVSGELDQSLSFNLDDVTTRPLAKRVVASKQINQISAPDSPYENWFHQYATQFGVEVKLLKHIAWCESHYHFDSVSGSGTYGGMFQYSASTWSSTRRAMGADPNPELRFNPEQAILTSAFKIAAGGISAWPVCGK